MGLTISPPAAGGESSTPELPVWTWEAGGGDPTSGHFTTNNAAPGSTTHIKFHHLCKQGSALSDLFATGDIALYCKILLTSATTGKVSAFEWSSSVGIPDNGGEDVTLSLAGATNESAWDGDYSVSLGPNDATVSVSEGVVNADEIALFSSVANRIKSTGVKLVDLATAAQGALADSALQPAGDISGTSGVSSAITTAINNAIATMLADPTTLATILAAASITPVSNGTVDPVTSITTASGIVTAAS